MAALESPARSCRSPSDASASARVAWCPPLRASSTAAVARSSARQRAAASPSAFASESALRAFTVAARCSAFSGSCSVAACADWQERGSVKDCAACTACSITLASPASRSDRYAATSSRRRSRQRMRRSSNCSDWSPRTRVASQTLVCSFTQRAAYASTTGSVLAQTWTAKGSLVPSTASLSAVFRGASHSPARRTSDPWQSWRARRLV